MSAAPNSSAIAVGMRAMLPSGRVVEVLRPARNSEFAWFCAYVRPGAVRRSDASNWSTLVLLDRWLRHHARPIK